MKKNLFKKLLSLCAIAFAGVALASCQSTKLADAKVVIVKESVARIYTDETDGKRYANATIGVENNSIYDVYTWDLKYRVTYNDGRGEESFTSEASMGVRHGAAGYVTFVEEIKDDAIIGVSVYEGAPKKTLNIWQSYIAWWIAGFAVLLCSVIFFGFKLFQETFTREEAKQALSEHIGSSLFGALLVLLVVMFPLIMGSWVPTVILAGALVGSLVICGIMTAIKAALAK